MTAWVWRDCVIAWVTVSRNIQRSRCPRCGSRGKIRRMPPEAAISGLEEFLAEHSALLKLLHTRASAARWNVSCEEFATALYRSAAHHLAAAPGEPAEKYFGGLHLEDLALACALRKGSEPAWEQFVSEYRPILRAAARAIVGGGQGGRAGGARARTRRFALCGTLRPGPEGRGAQDLAARLLSWAQQAFHLVARRAGTAARGRAAEFAAHAASR